MLGHVTTKGRSGHETFMTDFTIVAKFAHVVVHVMTESYWILQNFATPRTPEALLKVFSLQQTNHTVTTTSISVVSQTAVSLYNEHVIILSNHLEPCDIKNLTARQSIGEHLWINSQAQICEKPKSWQYSNSSFPILYTNLKPKQI